MRTILITNDDGIMADGLYRLAKESQHFGRIHHFFSFGNSKSVLFHECHV